MHPMKCSIFGFALLCGTAGLAAPGGAQTIADAASGAEVAVPTFYGEVMAILQDNCVECHQPQGLNAGGMVAPMSLVTYEEAREYSRRIAQRVRTGSMPPWDVHPRHKGQFLRERYLEEDERATLIAWAEGGAPAGDPRDAPPRRQFRRTGGDEWWIGEPDFTLFFDEPYVVPDDLEDRYVDIPVQLTEEMMPEHRWVKAREARPGGPWVHHIVGGIEGMAPGYMPTVYRDGYSSLFCKGPRTITFNMHYNKEPGPGTAVEDLSGGAVIFYEAGDTIRHVVEGVGLGIMDFLIPAGDPDYSASTEYVFEEDSYILGFNPHMHLRGKAARYVLVYPDGREEILLEIPHYNFNWQQGYDLRDPKVAPAGSRLELTLWWDNSADNPFNPDPTVDVRWGRPTTAEMGYGFMDITPVTPREIVVGGPIPEDVEARCYRQSPGVPEGPPSGA